MAGSTPITVSSRRSLAISIDGEGVALGLGDDALGDVVVEGNRGVRAQERACGVRGEPGDLEAVEAVEPARR